MTNHTIDEITNAIRDFDENTLRYDNVNIESAYIAIDCMRSCILAKRKIEKSKEVQPVDTKEILRHLDSMMICIGNAYDTSHGLLESDMEFIEKQEKIIKELLTIKSTKG